MNEENTTVETTEEIAQIEAAFDEDWNEDSPADDDMDLSDEAEPETETATAEDTEPAEAEQAEAEPEETKEAEPEKQPETGNQRFKLKHLGEESEVDLDTVIALAQKGMDYDHVREERDNLKADSAATAKWKAQESFLKELADSSGITVEQLMENTRARMLMSNDENLTEEEALAKVREANKTTEKKEEPKAEATPEERRQAMFASFLAAYPNVKAEEIPQEVWEDAGRTYDLNGAYQRWENRQLRKEIETLRQNQKNKERSTGSRRSVGATKIADDFDAGWDSEF